VLAGLVVGSMSGRFIKGQSGNPRGRPKARRPHVSAFDIIFDKRLTVVQGGVERELTIDEALELQTYQSALKGNRAAIRIILKMIEKREIAMKEKHPKAADASIKLRHEFSTNSADEAMRLLRIASDVEGSDYEDPLKLETWAAQTALSRPGRSRDRKPKRVNVNVMVHDSHKLRWPEGSAG
jgi:hypothetical protein